MTPTEQDKEFFVEHQEFFERLWEPKFGDLVLCWDGDKAKWGKDLWCVIGRFSEDAVDVIRERDGAIGAVLIVDCALLPRPHQLWEMLEERGYRLYHLGDERLHPDFEGRDWNPDEPYQAIAEKEPGDYVKGIGPTRAIALARALLAVVKEER